MFSKQLHNQVALIFAFISAYKQPKLLEAQTV